MPQLTTQMSVRHARSFPWCYFCGKPFTDADPNCPDHIPPQSAFHRSDRNFPLKLSAHSSCNGRFSDNDQMIGQWLGIAHQTMPPEKQVLLKTNVYKCDSLPSAMLGIHDLNILPQIKRWVRGFHAALYREFLSDSVEFGIQPPMPHGYQYEYMFTINKPQPIHFLFVSLIKKNRVADRLDRIRCNNGKLSYECFWICDDAGSPMCVFALNIYDWVNLADTTNFQKRGCVGYYRSLNAVPTCATFGTNLDFPFQNNATLDPFAD